jgi:flagellar biosynthesis regulator FlaF
VLLAKELLKQYQESENPDLQSITKLKWLLYRFKIITNCINQLKKLQETVPDDLTVSLISHAVKATSKVSEASAKENFEKELAELAKNITLDQEEDMLKTASEHIPPDDLISSINGLSKEITTEIMSRSGIFHAPITQSPVAEPMLSTAVPSESDMPQASMAASLGNSMSSLGGPFHRSSQQPLQLHKEQDNLPQIKNDGKPATLADAAIFDPMQLSAAAAPAETSSNSTNQKSSLTSDELANTKFKNKE